MAAEDYHDIYDLTDFDYMNQFDEGDEGMPYDEVKCPECNGEMVSRTGKFGVFWGCKDFPKCKGTRDSQGRSREDRQKEKDDNLDVDRAQGRTTFNKRRE